MNSEALSVIIFALVLGGVFIGSFLRRALPHHHLSKDSQEVVRLGVGLIATISALVLGLLIAAAKGSFDTQSGQVKQITADIILTDDLMAEYGPAARPIRQQIRATLGGFVDRLWREQKQQTARPYEADATAEKVYLAILALAPQDETQKALQSRAVQVINDLAQTRLLLFAEANSAIPVPFIAILVFWLVIIFASFSLFAALNPTTFSFLCVFALSAACAMFLILELSQPFRGLLMIPSAPLRAALAPLAP